MICFFCPACQAEFDRLGPAVECYRACRSRRQPAAARPVCACGQTIWSGDLFMCADCMCHPDAKTPVVALDTRIAEAKPADADPTSGWSAGELPAWEWP